MTNFLSQPTIEAIQTLLIIGNVLAYNMNPGVSYVLLGKNLTSVPVLFGEDNFPNRLKGMSTRMGLVLGLQVESNRFSLAEKYIRRRVW
jgi:hypothetical protein